jgi:hypothetical protein
MVAHNELDAVVAKTPSVSQTGGDSNTSIFTHANIVASIYCILYILEVHLTVNNPPPKKKGA